jgi:hypothetical protein
MCCVCTLLVIRCHSNGAVGVKRIKEAFMVCAHEGCGAKITSDAVRCSGCDKWVCKEDCSCPERRIDPEVEEPEIDQSQ